MVQIASFWEIPVGTRLQNMYDVVKVDTMVSQYLQYAGSDTVKSTPPLKFNVLHSTITPLHTKRLENGNFKAPSKITNAIQLPMPWRRIGYMTCL